MSWVTLSLRKQTLKAEISELNFEDIQLSHQKRAISRHLSYEKSIFSREKKASLAEAKTTYLNVRDERKTIDTSDTNSTEYKDWSARYSEAEMDWKQQQEEINDYYDQIQEDLEAEANDREEEIDEEITTVETQRDAMNAELQAITDEVKSEIENSAIKF